ncbi:MAG: 2-oxo acid dehydrogenase subunit E2 [Solirubrobacterales bacterium]|nr:2-oxo acid dehydrogenase subunit E2 [Solirubrobacterales bacterium]
MSSSVTEATDVTMPQMGVSVAEGTVVAWHVKVGDTVAADQTVCEVSTDKIDTEVPAPAAGVVSEILVEVEQTVPVGAVLARLGGEGGAQGTQNRVSPERGRVEINGQGEHRYYSPVVRRIAADKHVDLERIQGSGRNGRVRKQDVLAAAETQEPPLHIESPYRPDEPDVPAPVSKTGETTTLSRMRRQIGEHMKRSQQTAATCTTWAEADMTAVEQARAKSGLTALPHVARACITALAEHPALNATLEGEDYAVHHSVNLGIAVSLGENGLIVPVIHNAQDLSVQGLAGRIKDLARRARAGQLSPDETRGGTFTITNPGQYGSIMATPVINQPQVAILDLEAVVKRPVVIDDAIAIRAMTILGLSWDHRALDGVLAAQFLATLRGELESVR